MFGLGVEGGVDEKHIPLFLFIKIRMGEDGNRWIPFHYLVLSLVFTPLNLKYRGWNPIFLIHKIFNLILFLYNRPLFTSKFFFSPVFWVLCFTFVPWTVKLSPFTCCWHITFLYVTSRTNCWEIKQISYDQICEK